MRSTPLQLRSSQRIAQFLEAAAAIIAEVGYDATTMTEIAERAGASIGALYRWFPDKASVAQELRTQYSQQLEAHFKVLINESEGMSVSQFSEALIDGIVEFTRRHPAWLAIHAATLKPVRDPAARKNLREEFAQAFRAFAPHLSPDHAFLIANVALEIVKGLMGTFRQAPQWDREGLIREFKVALTLYLSHALGRES
jgi:AcrR family transcriptional regulator